jgi:hypothetical protein
LRRLSELDNWTLHSRACQRAKIRNFAYLSPVFLASLYAAEPNVATALSRLSNAIKATRLGAVLSMAVEIPGGGRNFPPASEETFEARGLPMRHTERAHAISG